MALRPRGRFVTCGNTTGDSVDGAVDRLPVPHGLCASSAAIPTARTSSRRRWDTFCGGGFDVVIDSEWPLVEAAAAQQKMLESDFFGKIILRPT